MLCVLPGQSAGYFRRGSHFRPSCFRSGMVLFEHHLAYRNRFDIAGRFHCLFLQEAEPAGRCDPRLGKYHSGGARSALSRNGNTEISAPPAQRHRMYRVDFRDELLHSEAEEIPPGIHSAPGCACCGDRCICQNHRPDSFLTGA